MARINTNMASEFWFYSQLHRLGYEAYITLGNTKAIDIVVVLNDKNKTRLTFDVKGKESFESGTYQYLPKEEKENHFFVFVGLQIIKNKNSKKIDFYDNVQCYIIDAKNLHLVAFNWAAKSSDAKGYGLDPIFFFFVKSYGDEIIRDQRLNGVLKMLKIKEVDFKKYNKIIMTLNDFELRYYKNK